MMFVLQYLASTFPIRKLQSDRRIQAVHPFACRRPSCKHPLCSQGGSTAQFIYFICCEYLLV